ncbi:MAG: cytochrome c3 family protein, partial [Pirellulales bacterium]
MSKADSSQSRSDQPQPASGRWKRRLFRFGFALVALIVVAAAIVGMAEHRTSQPEFCASCHVMTPYYESWKADIHATKLGVKCVDCHYAPGERTTIKAKFRGLSQATSYFSGRYGATRPRAHVANESCITSNCHGNREFMDKPLTLGTVTFIHAHHLDLKDEADDPSRNRLSELTGKLRDLVGEGRLVELESLARESGPAEDRYNRMAILCSDANTDVDREMLIEFSQLHHRPLRLAQLRNLQCTNCHSYVGNT